MKPELEREFPPGNFNVTEFVFRPNFTYSPRPGLADKVESLMREARYRSALEPLFEILSETPHDQEALTLALLVLGKSRTERVQADEALGLRYLLDRRVDPIYAVCSDCKRTSWVPDSCLYGSFVQVNNPAGLQCRNCGYVICRKCYIGVQACPNCEAAALRAPVYPTGRLPRQMERRQQPVAAAIVFREGPIPPDREWLTELFEPLSPDVLEAGVHLSVYPVQPWREDMQGIGMAVAANLISEGRVGAAKLENAIGDEVRSSDGMRVYVLKLYA